MTAKGLLKEAKIFMKEQSGKQLDGGWWVKLLPVDSPREKWECHKIRGFPAIICRGKETDELGAVTQEEFAIGVKKVIIE